MPPLPSHTASFAPASTINTTGLAEPAKAAQAPPKPKKKEVMMEKTEKTNLSKLSVWLCGPEDASKERELRVDAKTPMANERTLLRWLRSAVLLSSVSALLSSFPDIAARI